MYVSTILFHDDVVCRGEGTTYQNEPRYERGYVEEVIWTLEKKSDITFFYNVSDVSKVTNVSAVFKDASLEARFLICC